MMVAQERCKSTSYTSLWCLSLVDLLNAGWTRSWRPLDVFRFPGCQHTLIRSSGHLLSFTSSFRFRLVMVTWPRENSTLFTADLCFISGTSVAGKGLKLWCFPVSLSVSELLVSLWSLSTVLNGCVDFLFLFCGSACSNVAGSSTGKLFTWNSRFLWSVWTGWPPIWPCRWDRHQLALWQCRLTVPNKVSACRDPFSLCKVTDKVGGWHLRFARHNTACL